MIAKALSHEPKILFLDEPTAGVDVGLRKNLWKYLNKLKKERVTIFLTTHYIEEAEKLADKIAIINNGKIIINESKNNIFEKLGTKKVIIKLKEGNNKLDYFKKKYSIEIRGRFLTLTFGNQNNDFEISDFLSELSKHSVKFNDISIEKSNLEEIFVKIVKK